jgi:hypothetical protein
LRELKLNYVDEMKKPDPPLSAGTEDKDK